MNVIKFPGNPNSAVDPIEKLKEKTAQDRFGNEIGINMLVKSYKIFTVQDYKFSNNKIANKNIAEELSKGRFIVERVVDLDLDSVKIPDGISTNQKIPCLILKYAGGLNIFKNENFKDDKAQRELKLQENQIAVVAKDVQLSDRGLKTF